MEEIMKPNFIAKPRENPFRALSHFHEPGKQETVRNHNILGMVLQFKSLLRPTRVRRREQTNGFREQERSQETKRKNKLFVLEACLA
jgi:hypothetical protein